LIKTGYFDHVGCESRAAIPRCPRRVRFTLTPAIARLLPHFVEGPESDISGVVEQGLAHDISSMNKPSFSLLPAEWSLLLLTEVGWTYYSNARIPGVDAVVPWNGNSPPSLPPTSPATVA
jgi:hypothetical protein